MLWRQRTLLATALLLPGLAAATDTTIQHQIDEVNAHFEVASEHFGDGIVQLHSRREGPEGEAHSVHHFDCVNGTYEPLFAEQMRPEAFPLGINSAPASALQRDTMVGALAQHACTKHGYPLLKW